MENFLLMRLFAVSPVLASTWISEPEKFRDRWTPKEVRKAVFRKKPERATNYERFYWLLCDYSHPSFKGWYELFRKQNDGVFISSRPEFNADYASECIGLICFAIIQSVKAYVDAFKPWLDQKIVDEGNRLMPKLHEMVTRHFEVRSYDKKELLKRHL